MGHVGTFNGSMGSFLGQMIDNGDFLVTI